MDFITSDRGTVAHVLRRSALALLLLKLIAISGVRGGASQAAYARLVEGLSACTASKFIVRIFQHGSATARLYGVP